MAPHNHVSYAAGHLTRGWNVEARRPRPHPSPRRRTPESASRRVEEEGSRGPPGYTHRCRPTGRRTAALHRHLRSRPPPTRSPIGIAQPHPTVLSTPASPFLALHLRAPAPSRQTNVPAAQTAWKHKCRSPQGLLRAAAPRWIVSQPAPKRQGWGTLTVSMLSVSHSRAGPPPMVHTPLLEPADGPTPFPLSI